MKPERYERLVAVFHRACELGGRERDAWLSEACDGDAHFLAEVQSMLAADERGDAVLESAAAAGADLLAASAHETAALPQWIGRYRILGLLGEGGMGVVYEAEQERPKRRVALKVVRPGFTTPKMLRRFEFEAEVLGRLDHPGIAAIFESGTAETPAGPSPFFAMELVRGVAVTTFVERHQWSATQRIETLARIADAVDHAHAKGIIHRDLKPANVLVMEGGQPKILDFGVARLASTDIEAALTAHGQVVGTLIYASPEQASGELAAVDVRSDVYSLGVLGYELVSGELPYDFGKRDFSATVRAIETQEPRPLTATTPLARELDTILGKALEKDPERRYPSASALAADLRRLLRHEPIEARPATTLYQLRKFARRHRGLVGGVVLALAALLVATAATAVFAWEAVRDRDRAEQAGAATAEINDFLSHDLLAQVDPDLARGGEPTVREVLDRASARIGQRFVTRPLVEAELRLTIGRTYMGLGDLDLARQHLDRAAALFEAELGGDHVRTLDALSTRAELCHRRSEHEESLELWQRVHDSAVAVFGPEDERALRALAGIGDELRAQSRFEPALKVLRQLVTVRVRRDGPEHAETLTARNNLALVLDDAGDHEGAARVLRDVLEIRRVVLTSDHPDTLITLNNLALSLWRQKEYDRALPLFEECLSRQQRVLGAEHPDTLLTANNLALVYDDLGRDDEAEKSYREALAVAREKLGPTHRQTLQLMGNLSVLLAERGAAEEARSLATEVLEGAERAFPAGHWVLGAHHLNLAIALHRCGSSAEGLAHVESAYQILFAALGPDDGHTKRAVSWGLFLSRSLELHDEEEKWQERTALAK